MLLFCRCLFHTQLPVGSAQAFCVAPARNSVCAAGNGEAAAGNTGHFQDSEQDEGVL